MSNVSTSERQETLKNGTIKKKVIFFLICEMITKKYSRKGDGLILTTLT